MSLSMATRPFDLLAAIDKKSKDSSGGMPVYEHCLLYTSPSPRDLSTSRMPSSA